MQGLDPMYRLHSRASSSKCSQAAQPLEYMTLVSQKDCYGVIVQALCPTAQPVQPPFSQRETKPHYSSISPYTSYSYRISGSYFEAWRGPVNNIIYQSKLIGIRGNHPTYPFYQPVELQISQ